MSLRFWENLVFAVILLFLVQVVWSSLPQPCRGWDCEEVECRPGYAVEVPGKGFLPCDKFERYVDGDESVLLKRGDG